MVAAGKVTAVDVVAATADEETVGDFVAEVEVLAAEERMVTLEDLTATADVEGAASDEAATEDESIGVVDAAADEQVLADK